MVFGLDEDGANVFGNTLKWLIANKIETVTSHILTPYPGTALYHRLKAANRITDRNLAHYNTAHVVFRPLKLSEKELYRGYLSVYRKFYSLKNIIRRRPKNHKQQIPYFLFNFLYRKLGRFSSALCRIIPPGVLGCFAEKFSYKV